MRRCPRKVPFFLFGVLICASTISLLYRVAETGDFDTSKVHVLDTLFDTATGGGTGGVNGGENIAAPVHPFTGKKLVATGKPMVGVPARFHRAYKDDKKKDKQGEKELSSSKETQHSAEAAPPPPSMPSPILQPLAPPSSPIPDTSYSTLTSDIVPFYSSGSVDSCSDFRSRVAPEDRRVAVAGMFNTGTNLIQHLLNLNCKMPTKKTPFQVPWGKHNPVSSFRGHHFAKSSVGEKPENYLPVLLVKDPATWINSMCKHSYAANWPRKYKCPHIAKEGGEGVEVTVVYKSEYDFGTVNYDSLVDLWSRWYGSWVSSDFPFIALRFEDVLYKQEAATKLACECAGGTVDEEFKYQDRAVKNHGGQEDAEKVMRKYGGDESQRFAGWRPSDILLLNQTVDARLIELFQYRPAVSSSVGEEEGEGRL